MTENVEKEVRRLAEEAKAASVELGMASFDVRNAALRAMAASLRAHTEDVLAANAQDMEAARAGGMKDSLLDRLLLTEERVEGMASALEELAALPDSLGRVLEDRTLGNGLRVQRVTVPFGVVAMVYEARPNVTADAAGICVKTGNACVLRSGSSALHSSIAIANVLHEAAVGAGLPRNCIRIVESTDRSSADALMRMHGVVDLLIPRGGAGLIRRCVENATVPVIETGTGNCHVYVHEAADLEKARAIVMNAKTQRTGVCNACESLLVDRSIAQAFLPEMLAELARAGVLVHGDAEARTAASVASEGCADAEGSPLAQFVDATEEDWGTEYLGARDQRKGGGRPGRGNRPHQPLRYASFGGHRDRGCGRCRTFPRRGGCCRCLCERFDARASRTAGRWASARRSASRRRSCTRADRSLPMR